MGERPGASIAGIQAHANFGRSQEERESALSGSLGGLDGQDRAAIHFCWQSGQVKYLQCLEGVQSGRSSWEVYRNYNTAGML